MKLRLKENPGEWVKFMLLNAGVMGLILTLLWWRHVLPGRWWARGLGVLALVALLVLIQARWFRGFYRVGMRLSHRLGEFTGGIFLTIFFLLVLTPLGLALRLFGKDLLRLKRDPRASTYWQPARPPNSLDRLF